MSALQIVGPTGTSVGTTTLIAGTSPSQYYVNVTWTPSATQIGPNVICATATDTSCLNSENHCYTVLAGVPIPALVSGTCTPTGFLNKTTIAGVNGVITWSVQFNEPVLQPIQTTYISYYYGNGTLLFQIDASTFPTVTYDNYTLTWTTGNSFVDGPYYILFDYGMGLGPQYCLPQSDAITDPTFCAFVVNTNITAVTTTKASTATAPVTVSGQTLPLNGISSTGSSILPLGVNTTTSTSTLSGNQTATSVFTTSSTAAATSFSTSAITTTTSSVYNSSVTLTSVNSVCRQSNCTTGALATLLTTCLTTGISGHLSSMTGVFLYLMKKKKTESALGIST